MGRSANKANGSSRWSALLQLPRGADQRSHPRGLPLPRHRSLAAYAPAARPETPDDLAADRTLADQWLPKPDPPSLAESTLRRQTPKVGAVCGKPHVRFCAGCPVMRIPTAIRNRVVTVTANQPRTVIAHLDWQAPSRRGGLQPFNEAPPKRLLLLQQISSKTAPLVAVFVDPLEIDESALPNRSHPPVPPVLSGRDQASPNSLIETVTRPQLLMPTRYHETGQLHDY